MVAKKKLTILLDPSLRNQLSQFLKSKKQTGRQTEEEVVAAALKTYMGAMQMDETSDDSDIDELITKITQDNQTRSRDRDS